MNPIRKFKYSEILRLFESLDYFENLDTQCPSFRFDIEVGGEDYKMISTYWYSVISSVLRNHVMLRGIPDFPTEALQWCRDNLDDRFDVRDVSFKYHDRVPAHRFRFQSKIDATGFKLRWI